MKKFVVALLMVTVLLTFIGCDSADKGTDDEKTVLTIGVDDTYPPMEFRDDNNDLVGFDVDFAKALSEELDMDIEFVPTAWDGIFVGLTADKYDVIISSVSMTEERLESYEFSKPYLSNGQVIVVAPGDNSINSSADLAGKKVGVQLETTADIAAKKQQEITPFELTQYDEIIQTFADMKAGRLDCIVVDYAVALDFVSKNPDDYVITTTQLTNEPIAVCIKKGNTDLVDQINAALVTLQDSGKMAEISDEWFGADYVSNIDEELRQ